jgi:hypothetical protein
VDGVKERSTPLAYSGSFSSGTAPLTIGWLSLTSGYYFSGGIDEVALYNIKLSENEIRQHYYDGAVGLRWGYCGCSQAVKIMPLGDSITHGIFGDPPDEYRTDDQIGGYRYPLHTSLIDAGNYIDFVGSLSSGGSLSGFDSDHEGRDGYCAKNISGLCPYGELTSNIPGILSANPADVILLHIGTNDISFGVPNIVDNVFEILDNIDTYNPDAVVVLSRIINRTDVPAMATATTEFNNALAIMAAARIAGGDRIVVVDHENALNYPGDMLNALHPNEGGYNKMAAVWQNALKTFLPVCGPVEPSIQSDPVTQATAGKPYIYNVNSTGNPAPVFTLETYPAGMTINAGTGLIQWAPAVAGSFSVVVQAGNSEGTDTQSFTIQVSETPPCTTGMIHYWKLDELFGQPYQDFYWINDATCTDCPVATAGIVNGAQQFNGTTNMVSVPMDASFNWGSTSSFSIEFWMKPKTPTTCEETRVMVGRNETGKVHWWVGCEENKAAFYLYDNTATGGGVSGTRELTDTAWHHLVAVRDAGTNEIRIYVDGAPDGALSISYANGFDALFTELNVGWLNLGEGYHFPGAIDEVALYDRALTATEILQHYSYGIGITPKGYCETAAPAIISSPITGVMLGQSYTYDVEAMGNPAPAYSLTTKPSGMDINVTTGVIQWTPAAVGSFEVTVQASNSAGSPSTQSFTIVVGGTAPSITSTPIVSVMAGQPYTYDVEATGTPAPAFSLTTKPLEMTINETTGVIQWTPGAVGSFEVTVQAGNGIGSPDSQSFTVVVEMPPASCVNGPVWLGGMEYGASIWASYQSLTNDATVMITEGTMTEDLDLSTKSYVVELRGGYDCGFSTSSGFTTVKGTLAIGMGTIIVDAIAIE